MAIQITITAATKSFYRCLTLGICVTKENNSYIAY